MKKTAAWLARYALEQLPVEFTFGVPGVHNTELYDELHSSPKITPVLVTHECGAAFMADAVSRTSQQIGTLVIVPAAGVTHAASGIGEAFLDGIPMLILCGGVRTDLPYRYQLHQMDQMALVKPITKAQFYCHTHAEVVPNILEAYSIATGGEPGPVFVEIPVNLQLFPGTVDELLLPKPPGPLQPPSQEALIEAADLLATAQNPAIFAGWGAAGARQPLQALAERLEAPVATTLQGLSVFPADHPLHVGMGFGPAAVPAAENAFRSCDCLLAVGTRFSEIATGSFGIQVPEKLIHMDINPQVFSTNYPARVTLGCDAAVGLQALLNSQPIKEIQKRPGPTRNAIATDKQDYVEQWRQHDSHDRVNPMVFFDALDKELADNALVVADDGNHTFLTAELMPMRGERQFISPTDFNCMGYALPAAIGTKLVNPEHQVAAIVGDGALLMSGLEASTASLQQTGIVVFVFADGALSQIAQAQKIPYQRTTCVELGPPAVKGIATATGCDYLQIEQNSDCSEIITRAFACAAKNRPVLVEVRIDYSKPTRFTRGAVKTNLGRFSTANKLRFVGRALWRKARSLSGLTDRSEGKPT